MQNLISIVMASLIVTQLLVGCGDKNQSTQIPPAVEQKPSVEEAKAFLLEAEARIEAAGKYLSRASWLAATYISYDSQTLEAKAKQEYKQLAVELAHSAARFNAVQLDGIDRRKLDFLKQALIFPAPKDNSKSKELADIGSTLGAIYAEGRYCRADGECFPGSKLEHLMKVSRNSNELNEYWRGWRTISPPMKSFYQRQVEIGNEGAQQLGYDNLSVYWRSKYDANPDAFVADVEAQWQKVKPFYTALHCHVRAKLNGFYGDDTAPSGGPIPAHILGDQWAQQWGKIYDLVAPPNTGKSVDLDELVQEKIYNEIEMVKIAEQFFISLGFEPLPQTFWERSMFVEPIDHKAVCQASAWSLDGKDDLRINMCIQKSAEDFTSIHQKLGHNFYQRAYKDQSILFRGGANDGFHQAFGDTVLLSLTPKYLRDIGWLDKETNEGSDLDYLMKMALDDIAFLPWGLLVDKWRWQVFSGDISPEQYNSAWWKLRNEYQGVSAPIVRSETDFDAGAKYHIAANTPYMRHFLALIQKFQFHRSLCEAAGHQGALHRCSIYGSQAAGDRLDAMMSMGASQPWPDAMEAITGQRALDASAIVDYFRPLQVWLDHQNNGRECGW